MKRNWIVIAFTFLLTAALWAQAGATTPKTETKAAGCACCNAGDKTAGHDMANMKDHAGMSCCNGKDAKACSRKDGKGGCCAGMKKDAKLTASSATNEEGCCGKEACTKDCCKDGKCTMAKNGKCCEHCNMGDKTATGQ